MVAQTLVEKKLLTDDILLEFNDSDFNFGKTASASKMLMTNKLALKSNMRRTRNPVKHQRWSVLKK